jgi:hypothetical protein
MDWKWLTTPAHLLNWRLRLPQSHFDVTEERKKAFVPDIIELEPRHYTEWATVAASKLWSSIDCTAIVCDSKP